MKTILLTGATDGIGLATAKMLAPMGHRLLLHGRDISKLEKVRAELSSLTENVEIFAADLAVLTELGELAAELGKKFKAIDVIINNAGVFMVENSRTPDGLDARFAINTIAPYVLTKKLLSVLTAESRVVNLASAAQAPVNFAALAHYTPLSPDDAYAQSKLALIMWSLEMAKNYPHGPMVVAVNPKSFLGSKMVQEAYGRKGYDLTIGADILVRAALSLEFAAANGKYYDNDIEAFASPHPFALNENNRLKLISFLDGFLNL